MEKKCPSSTTGRHMGVPDGPLSSFRLPHVRFCSRRISFPPSAGIVLQLLVRHVCHPGGYIGAGTERSVHSSRHFVGAAVRGGDLRFRGARGVDTGRACGFRIDHGDQELSTWGAAQGVDLFRGCSDTRAPIIGAK